MLELLSPAGSMEALRAAVQNGANAVYLGYDMFNARMNAKNFSADELQEAIVYCHVRGVAVHLTLNTLVADREMARAADVIRLAATLGVDAFIVQDIGMVQLCREIAPNVAVHASTQMSIHSLVHGALCMCYSGQCYLSGVIGRRSGNRGQCAQPCRLPYGYGRFDQNRYPLSLKDNCLIEYLRDLERMGVASLKIEGRMKRPEYVAVVTKAYRAALNGKRVTQADMEELERVFSRQGFTQGYYLGQKGQEMFGTRQEGEDAKELFAAARATYENGEAQLVPVHFYAMLQAGRPAQLAVQDDLGNVCKTVGPEPEPAVYHALTREDLESRLAKTGGTPYRCASVKTALGGDVQLPASAINAMRRDVLAQLTAQRGRVKPARLHPYNALAPYDGMTGEPQLTVSVRSASQITARMLALRPTVLYVPLAEILANPDLPGRLGVETQLAAVLPRVTWSGEDRQLVAQLREVYALGVRQLLVGNLGQLKIAKAAGFAVRGDFGLNIYNSRSMQYLRAQGVDSQLLSFELTLPQIRDISKAVPSEVLVYGRLPLMLMENCVIKNRTGTCACDAGVTKLVDRMGEEFPIVKDGGSCRNVLLNGKKLYLLDKLAAFRGMGLWALRLSFTTENAGEVDKVLADWVRGGTFEPGSYTRGLYQRGVE